MYGLKILVFLLVIGYSYKTPDLKIASAKVEEVSIPDLFISHNDSEIVVINGLLFCNTNAFSGYVIEYFDNGQLKEKMPYFKGKREGKMESFYESGQRNEIRFFKNNKKSKTHQAWWPNGSPRFVYHLENGVFEGNCRDWYDDNSLFKDFNYKNGKEEGSQRMWNSDGSLKANYVMKKGRRFGLIGSKPCYTVKNETIQN